MLRLPAVAVEGCVIEEMQKKRESIRQNFVAIGGVETQSSGPLLVSVDGLQNCHGRANNSWQAGRALDFDFELINQPKTQGRSELLVHYSKSHLLLGIASAAQSHKTTSQIVLKMTDRRRINGPVGGTLPPVFAGDESTVLSERPTGRTRPVNTARPICESSCPRSIGTNLTALQSPQDWCHSFSVGLCIS